MSIKKNLKLVVPTIRRIAHIPEKVPKFVQISFTNHCNLSCKMCIRNYIDVDRRHMHWEDFTRIVDKLNGVEQISLAGMGESLTHPLLFDAIKYCKIKGFKVQLTTNALLLESIETVGRLIQSGIDSLSFSLESVLEDYKIGHNNTKSVKNIERLIEMKQKFKSNTPKIVIQPILFKDKVKDIYEIIKWSAKKDIDRINIVRVDLRFVQNMKRPSVTEERNIFRTFDKLRKRYNVRVDCLQDQIFDGITGYIYKHTKRLLRLDTWCYRFQDFIYINVNGNVHPCCFSEEQVMGNLLEQNLSEIWRGNRFNHLRRNQESFSYCRKCDFLRLKQVA